MDVVLSVHSPHFCHNLICCDLCFICFSIAKAWRANLFRICSRFSHPGAGVPHGEVARWYLLCHQSPHAGALLRKVLSCDLCGVAVSSSVFVVLLTSCLSVTFVFMIAVCFLQRSAADSVPSSRRRFE